MCEDEETVRDLACRILEAAGYRVLVAAEGQAALDLAEKHPGPIHLLLTDVIMPVITGKQLSEMLAERRPGLPTLFSSGYTSNILDRHGVIGEGIHFLGEPYTRQAFLSQVREILDGVSGD